MKRVLVQLLRNRALLFPSSVLVLVSVSVSVSLLLSTPCYTQTEKPVWFK